MIEPTRHAFSHAYFPREGLDDPGHIYYIDNLDIMGVDGEEDDD